MPRSLDQRLIDGDVPCTLKGILLDHPWKLAKLLALDLPVAAISVDALRWQLELPWWRADGEWFVLTPNQVRDDPGRWPEQWDRTMRADLSAPIHVRTTKEQGPVILDGVHRLLKASVEGLGSLPACGVPDPTLSLIYR